MQFIPIAGWRLLFKSIASCNKFVQPSLTANIFDVDDERVPRMHQQSFVSVEANVVPSMSEKDIDLIIKLIAIESRADVKTTES